MSETAAPRAQHVAVIGSGIIGACIAVELVERGHRVTLIDEAEPGGAQAASYGNGAFISPASILPMSFPGMWRKIPSYLLDPTGPLTIRWRHLTSLAPWLCRFLWAGASRARYARTVAHLHALLQDAPARHLALAERAGLSGLIRQQGLIYAFRNRDAVATEAYGWELRRQHGVKITELEAAEMARLLPDLAPEYRFGLQIEAGAHCLDPGGYVAGLAAYACRKGAQFQRAKVTGFRQSGGKLVALQTSSGDIGCDAAVIAAGIASAELARQAGEALPLAAERGYHVELLGSRIGPEVPVMPQDGKMANVMTHAGLRAAGQVEVTAATAPPDWRRAEILLGHLRRSYPGLAATNPEIRRWMGHRPSTPDGLPIIAPARHIAGIYHAFGHGHVGLAAAPHSAALIADLIDGTAAPDVLAPLAAQRFYCPPYKSR